MLPISVVIITKDEEDYIEACIQSAQLISTNIIVVDSGSTDNTVTIAVKNGATVIHEPWKGYGANKNIGAEAAKHDWILSLDADERITNTLAKSIQTIDNPNSKTVFGFKRVNYFIEKKICFGEWKKSTAFRLYNKKSTSWNLDEVHETLFLKDLHTRMLKGELNHFTVKDMKEYKEKTIRYAKLSAEKYFRQRKKATYPKRFLSPIVNFFQYYILKLGFLDGKEGFIIAKTTAHYTWLKYNYLQDLYNMHSSKTNA